MTVFKYNVFFIGVTGFVIIFLSPCLDLSLDGIGEVQNTGFAFSIATGVAADFFGFNSRSREEATIADAVEILVFYVSIHTYLESGIAAHIFYNAARQMPASRIPTRSVRLSARRLQTRKTDSTHSFL